MAGLKDAYKNKSSEGYKDVFKEQSRKSGDYTSTPIEALRKPSKKNGGKVGQLSGIFKNKKEKAEQILENAGKIVEDIQGLVEE